MNEFWILVAIMNAISLTIAICIYFLSKDGEVHFFGMVIMMWTFSLPFMTEDGGIDTYPFIIAIGVYILCCVISFVIHMIMHTRRTKELIKNEQSTNIEYYKFSHGFESFDPVYYKKYNDEIYQKYFKMSGVEIVRCLFYWPVLLIVVPIMAVVYFVKDIRFPKINFNIFDVIMRRIFNKWIGH